MKVALVANTGWYLANFRIGLVRRLIAEGHDVVAIAPLDASTPRLRAAGARTLDLPLSRSGINPARELASVAALRRRLRAENPDAVLSYTPKGNIYSGLALRGHRAIFVVNVSGLGRSFAPGSRLIPVSRRLYALAFARADRVLFENSEDHQRFLALGLVTAAVSERIPGLGVDLDHFHAHAVTPAPREAGDVIVFLLAGRMLWDKGLAEYVDAATRVRAADPRARFQLLGFIEPPGAEAVPLATIQGWEAQGIVRYLGVTDDVRPAMLAADCIVLPSYYLEGVPRSLLEAAALARPIVTTDSVGCRDAVEDGVSGYLVRPRDAGDLAAKLLAFAALPPSARAAMGAAARARMEAQFDETRVLDRNMAALAAGRRRRVSSP